MKASEYTSEVVDGIVPWVVVRIERYLGLMDRMFHDVSVDGPFATLTTSINWSTPHKVMSCVVASGIERPDN